MLREFTASAPTVEEAKAKALLELGLTEDTCDLEIEVLVFPEKKKLGLFGGKNAEVRVSYDDGKPAQDLPTWINCYTPRFGDLKMDDDVWYDYKVVISSGMWHLQCSPVEEDNYTELASGNYYDGANYFYFMICPTASGDTFELYDFSITTASGTVTDNFDNNRSWMFVNSITKNAHHGSTGMKFVEQPTSFEPEELGDVAMKFVINDLVSEQPAMITKEAYAGGLTVSFKYFVPEGTTTSWWGLAYSTSNTGLSIYDAAGSSAKVISGSATVLGVWTEVSFTLPAGGPYYLYFGGEISATNWRFADGTKSYVLIDEFKVGDVYESFNFGVERSIFNIKANAARNSEIGDGWVNPYPAELGAKIYGDKISSTKTTPTFITKQAYTFTEPTVVSFDYYMTGNTNSKWWILAWTNNQRTASIYAHVENNKANNDGRDLPTNVQNSWAKASVEVPAGTWYFYIGMAKGEWSGGHVIIDNFKIGDQVTETFNNGITDSIFVVSPFSSHHSAIEEVEGIQPFVAGEYSASLNFTNSFDQNSKTFITKKAYAGGSTVSFMFNIPEETTIGDWWSINWDTNNTSPNFWAVGNGIAEGNGGINPTGGNKTSGTGWVEYSFTLPAGGPYYLYIVGYQNWNGVVYIDNFTVNGEVETFNNGFEESIFNVGNSSYVTLGEGVENSSSPEIPEEPENEDENALENLIKDGTIVDFLEDGGYASITTTSDVGINNADIPSTMILVEGTFKYTITGEKEFAIYLGNGQYIVIDQDSIVLYIGNSNFFN